MRLTRRQMRMACKIMMTNIYPIQRSFMTNKRPEKDALVRYHDLCREVSVTDGVDGGALEV